MIPEGIFMMVIAGAYMANDIYKLCKSKYKAYWVGIIFDFIIFCAGALITTGIIS